jgi:hypothetical protein
MKNFAIVSGGRCGSSTLASHICSYLNAPLIHVDIDTTVPPTPKFASVVYKCEAPWLIDKISNPADYSLILIDRIDQLSQVLSKCQLFIKQKAHKGKTDLELASVTISKELFYFCAHHTLLFNLAKLNPKIMDFKNTYYFNYEEMISDWHSVGETLSFDWENLPGKDYLGWGNIWQKYINKHEIITWAKDCGLRFNIDEYPVH